jgi:prepilin-type N-terminal cleavage/methylation domain-containing protein
MKLVRTCRNSQNHSRRSGFSLVEMIGVLAIIAILAVIIVPRVFSTIASSRITNTVASVNSAKTAISDFAGKYGTLPVTNANGRIDDLLLTAGMLDSRFQVKIGTQPANPPVAGATWTNNSGTWTAAGGANQGGQSRLICLASTTGAPSTTNGANYQLDGATDLPTGARVVSAVVVNCTATEALEMSKRIDGESLSQAAAGTVDDDGKVVYRVPNAQGLTTVYVYLAHQ